MMTIIEAAKLKQNPLQRGIVEVFARTSPVLERLPFQTIAGGAYEYVVEGTLPSTGFRAVNTDYTESAGTNERKVEALRALGGKIRVDRFIVETQGNLNDATAIEAEKLVTSEARNFDRAFFRGDAAADENSFDGLQKRLTGTQVLNATAAGLTLNDIDRLIDSVEGGPDCLFMSKALRRQVNALMRAAGQAIETVNDVFGRQLMSYGGIPIAVVGTDGMGSDILGFDETDDTASIYACRFGVGQWVGGLQAGNGIQLIDQGLVDTWHQKRVEWICSYAVFHPKAAARLQGIKDSGI